MCKGFNDTIFNYFFFFNWACFILSTFSLEDRKTMITIMKNNNMNLII